MSDLTGTTLDGKYELMRLLGEGGMGTVYEATHRLIGRKLAVKFLHSQYVTSPDVVTRFQREAQAAAAIGHENIIEVTDMGTTPEGAPYIVMEFLNGQDVRELLGSEGLIPPERAARIMVQALSGLEAAHNAGIIHRDLKPENIFLINKPGHPDYVKLLDFGISKFRAFESEGAKGLTQTGTVLGTPYYMSPEQARGDQNLSPRSDIYSMGVILYQMLTGHLPFDAPNYNALLIKILTEDPMPPGELNPNLPVDIRETIQIAMARDANMRYGSAREFRKRLLQFIPGSSGLNFQSSLSAASRTAVEAALSSTPTETPLEMTQSGAFARSKNRLPLILGGVGLAAVAGIAITVFVGLKSSNEYNPAPQTLPAASQPLGTVVPPAAAAPAPEIAGKINVKISAEPANAAIEIDGAAVEGNPFVGSFPKDSGLHAVEIKAAGYQTASVKVRFDSDQDLHHSLLREEQPGEAASLSPEKDRSGALPSSHRAKKKDHSSSRSSKSKIEADTSKSATPARKKPRRKIDDEDPWG